MLVRAGLKFLPRWCQKAQGSQLELRMPCFTFSSGRLKALHRQNNTRLSNGCSKAQLFGHPCMMIIHHVSPPKTQTCLNLVLQQPQTHHRTPWNIPCFLGASLVFQMGKLRHGSYIITYLVANRPELLPSLPRSRPTSSRVTQGCHSLPGEPDSVILRPTYSRGRAEGAQLTS